MTDHSCLAIILAAGEGTRMKSPTPKVLHKIAGRTMVEHVVKAAEGAGAHALALVVGHQGEAVAKAVRGFAPSALMVTQEERLGTAHAVLSARSKIAEGYDELLVMFADTPLIDAKTLATARDGLADGKAVVVVGFRPSNPSGYGRLIEENGELVAIREDKECSDDERRIVFCNAGLMAIDGRRALELLEGIGNANAKGEFYLTDIVEVARAKGLKVAAVEAPVDNVLGVNTLVELAEAETVWQRRRRREMMLSGVTLVAPDTVWFAADTKVAAGAIIEQNVVFGNDVQVADGAVIHAFSHVEGAVIGRGANVGPFARLRPGADLHERAKVGNFCEVKKATIGVDAKVNHLAYIGDAKVGDGANIGAGTITCNYDGFSKFETVIGKGAFIGSNSALVAPVTVGDRAYVASGSVITQSVPGDALAFGRSRQSTLPGKGKELRDRLLSSVLPKTHDGDRG